MSQRNRLTTNSGETDIGSLISGDKIFTVPYFQRAYRWKSPKLQQLNADILSLVDGESDVHFLGAIIIHGRHTNPSDPDLFDVIDGQQRITTLFLYLCATVKILSESNQHKEAAGLFLKYLVINRETGAVSNYKIHSCKDDRYQLNEVYRDVLNDDTLRNETNRFRLLPLPKSGKEKGNIMNNYNNALRFFREELKQGGVERIRTIYSCLLNQMSVVQIDVWDPTNGPKIFDSLNSKQEPMTIGDLVRNEVFARVANNTSDEIERIDSEAWQPFYKKFDKYRKNLFDSYFFPYGLTKRPNLKKSEVYNSLKKDWDGKEDPRTIIDELSEYQDAFIDLQCGTNLCKHSKKIADAFNKLYRTNLPSSTFPFFLVLSRYLELDRIDEKSALAILEVVESFLVRRAACGHEPTGLHAVFKRLWSDCDGDYSAERVKREISKHKTVVWPSEEEFRKAIAFRSLYKTKIAPFLIIEYDRSLGGDSPVNIPWIEHVLPSKPAREWFDFFSKEEHEKFKDCLANLLPLSDKMNTSLGNRSYEEKRRRFRDDSMFKSTRQFANKYETWNPESLLERATHLSDWASKRWPHKTGTT